MKRFVVALMLASTSSVALAADSQCLAQKYDAYIDASLNWYSDLAQLTTQQYPDLQDVSGWFLKAVSTISSSIGLPCITTSNMMRAESLPTNRLKIGCNWSKATLNSSRVAVMNWVKSLNEPLKIAKRQTMRKITSYAPRLPISSAIRKRSTLR